MPQAPTKVAVARKLTGGNLGLSTGERNKLAREGAAGLQRVLSQTEARLSKLFREAERTGGRVKIPSGIWDELERDLREFFKPFLATVLLAGLIGNRFDPLTRGPAADEFADGRTGDIVGRMVAFRRERMERLADQWNAE